jgi:hypothetical protein
MARLRRRWGRWKGNLFLGWTESFSTFPLDLRGGLEELRSPKVAKGEETA